MWSAVIERGHKHARPNGLAYHVYVFNDGHLKYQSYDVQFFFDNQCVHYTTSALS